MFATTEITDAQRLDFDRILNRIRTNLPGFFVLAGIAELKFTDALPTACTDGRNIWFGNAFWGKLDQKTRAFVILHEVLHVALGHHLKRGDRDCRTFNVACDYVINRTLEKLTAKHDWLAAPTGELAGLLDSQYDADNEFDIYRKLTQPKPDQPQAGKSGKPDQASDGQPQAGQPGDDQADDQAGDGQPQAGQPGDDQTGDGQPSKASQQAQVAVDAPWGSVIDGDFETPEQLEKETQELAAIVQRAAVVEQLAGAGDQSGGLIEQLAAAARRRNRELTGYLNQFVNAIGTADWSRPNRRLAACGIHYAGPIRNATEKLVFAIDTSYSISDETIRQFAGVLVDVFARSNYSELHVVYFHTSVYRVDVLKRNQKFELAETQGGGTRFEPPFAYADKVGAKGLILLTDGEAGIPARPKFKVCWALINSNYFSPGYGVQVKL